MTSVLRTTLPSKSEDRDADYSMDYSIAVEYSGPPVSHDIPQVVPIDVRQIPTASVAAMAVMLNNFSIPVIQPIVKSDRSCKKASKELKSGSGAAKSQVLVERSLKFGSSVRVYSRKLENGSYRDCVFNKSNALDGARSPNWSGHADSNRLTINSDVEHLDDECKASVSNGICLNPNISESKRSRLKSQELSSEISSHEGVEDCAAEASGQGNRVSIVTFSDMPSSEAKFEESDHQEPAIVPERPVVSNVGKKGLCHRCRERNRFAAKVTCIVCGAKYCSKCVLRAMGTMPEGRKCITCIGFRIGASKQESLGKGSSMLKRLLTDDEVKRVMSSEISCEVNQLPPHLICVNDKPLSIEELVLLQSCPNPPKKLRPGKYWYDKVSGFWGKEGKKPCQIISAQLAVGYQIRQHASNGNMNIRINNREITKRELWMLKAAGIHCAGNPHFWVTADGSYQHEGMKNVMGKLWEKRRVKIVCAALSLPIPSDTSNPGGEDVEKDIDKDNANNPELKMMKKFLLVGCDQSGTNTIFKQAKIVYNVPFSEDEKQNIKYLIQRNVYSYIGILLEGHARFEEDYLIQMRRQHADEPGPSGNPDQVIESNIYSFSPKLKAFSDWLLQVMMSGNLEAIFPAATREYAPLVEELWKDKAFQATYKRRNELPALPRVADHFLNRAVEISRIDYEPSQMDILYAEGITSFNGVTSVEFSFPKPSQDACMESSDQNDPPKSCQVIRLHPSILGENCKWLHMFEDVNLVIFCVSLTDYDEYYEDTNGVLTNKMLAAKKLFESIVSDPALSEKNFLLILNKYDLLEEKIKQVPVSECDWFQDFNPVINPHAHCSTTNNYSPLAQRAFHYIAVQFKRLFNSITGRKLFVSRASGLEGDSVDRALRYGWQIVKWNDEIRVVSKNEWSTESTEQTTSALENCRC